jgi:hypothetical protein
MYTLEKSSTKRWAASVDNLKAAQSKQSPIGRKFAKFGHPACQSLNNFRRRGSHSMTGHQS